MLLSLLKPVYRFTALALASSFITVVHVLGSDNVTGQDGDFRRQLPDMLDLLCPYDKTCRGGDSRLQVNNGMESCCTECSCEDSCGLTESCCYPEQAAIRHFDRSHQQCVLPSTTRTERMKTGKHYYMVNGGYGNGGREDCGTGNATCGENEAASALGSLYPVSSKTTTLIYKNEQCASCHGVASSDIIPWQAVMTCPVHEDRFDTLLQSLEVGGVHDSCWLDFYYPGTQSEIDVHVCYENTKRSCLNYEGRSYYLYSYLNMTDDEVRAACLTGPQAQYEHFYNLFCALCNYKRYKAEDQCIRTSINDRSPSSGTFSALIRARFLDNKAIEQKMDVETKTRLQMACKRRDGLQIDYNDCKPALCPSGKVQLGSTCVYSTTTLFSNVFYVAVKLYPGNNRNISPLIDHLNSNLQQAKDWKTFIYARGLKSWHLNAVCYYDDTHQATQNRTIGFFWLKLKLEKTKYSSLEKILANVDKFMTGDWKFIVGMTSVPLEQSFSEFNDVVYDWATDSTKPLYIDSPDLELSCTGFGPSSLINPSIHVTKTFFCDQVALRPEEYVFDKGLKMMYVNETGRVFSPAEYLLGYDANGDPEPRLCLEDTDYVLVPQQHPASPSGAPEHRNWSNLALVAIAILI